MPSHFTKLILAGALLFGAVTAQAATASAFLDVTANVLPNCRVSITSLGFGSYDPMLVNATAPLDGDAELTMLCTRNTQVTVTFDTGRNVLGTVRGMVMGSDRLNYGLYRDGARKERWGEGTDALRVLGSGGRDAQVIPVFGRIPGGQEVGPGAYSDVVTAVVYF